MKARRFGPAFTGALCASACASGNRSRAPEPEATTPLIVMEDVVIADHGPHVDLAWGREASGGTASDMLGGVTWTVDPAKLPAHLRALDGATWLVDGACEVILTRPSIRAVIPYTEYEYGFYDHETEAELTEEQVREELAARGTRELVFETEPGVWSCGEQPLLAVRAGAPFARLARVDASPALAARAIAAYRAHGLSEAQQASYERSIAAERARVAKERAAIEAERQADPESGVTADDVWDLTTLAPARWDELDRDDAGARDGSEVAAFADADGKLRAVLVEAGNNLACSAPRAWFVFDAGETLEALAFGLGPPPTAIVDVDRDGRLELVFDRGTSRELVRPNPTRDAPEVLALAGVPEPGLACSRREQIRPLDAPPAVR